MRTFSVVLLLLFTSSTYAATARYDVRYDGTAMHVVAKLPAGDGHLLIAQGGGIDHLPDQWATFVRNLRVTTRDAKAIATKSEGKAGWALESDADLEAQYDVALDYSDGAWPAGNEQAGRRFKDALFTVTKPIFIYTSTTENAVVHFDVPAAYAIATPWQRDGADYRAATIDNLTNNTIVLGRFPMAHVRVGAFDVTVATPGMSETPPLLAKALVQTGSIATSVFDKTPPGVYLMTFFREESEDGESYENSAAVTSPDAFDRTGMIVTGNTMVHELLHHWIGGQLAPVEHDSIAWFTEGFTEYYANVAIARSGAVAADLLLRKFNNQVSGYEYFLNSSLFSGVPVAAAGKRKGAYRFGVYNAGWALALSLDVALRTESNGRRSLDDVMRLLYARNGLTRKPIATADIQSALEEVGGRSFAAFFQTYIAERHELPIGETLAKLGIEVHGQPYAADLFLIDAKPSELRRSMFGF
jgi:predicted metalloprotease with PDZ domain